MITVTVYGHVTVKAVCNNCGGSCTSSFKLDKDSLTTGNTTQAASFHLDQHERAVRTQMQRALWNDEMCGRCRIDAAERERATPPSSPRQTTKTTNGDE